jgi:hypothetical protein
MAINAEQTFSLDLSLFGSKVSDLNPANLPAGVSPDNSNCFYYPQGVASRPSFIHALAAAIGSVSVMSHKPYTPPGGAYGIVALDSGLDLSIYNVIDGSLDNVFTLSPWSGSTNQKYFSGTQLFDKFFMAFFDPINGLNKFSTAADVPRYINALGHCNRVSTECGGGLSVENVNLENLFNPGTDTISTGFTRANNIVTVTLNSYTGEYPSPMPVPGWFIQMYDSEATIPSFNRTSSWNQANPLNSGAVQSSGPGSNTAGNTVSVYYEVGSGSIDSTLLAAYNAALAGGYTLYVKIENPVIGPSGIFPVTAVATSDGALNFAFPNGSGGSNYEARAWFYFSYLVPGPAVYSGVNNIPDTTTATYSISTTALMPDGTNINSNGVFTNNELFQLIGSAYNGSGVVITSDASGTTKVTCPEPITNLPIGAWIYLVVPSSTVVPFSSGWVQVASVVSAYEFTLATPGAQIFTISGVLLFEYWGSLNTTLNLAQPIPGNPVGLSFSQTGAQGFQITAVEKLSDGAIQIQWYQLGPDSINGASAGHMALVPQSAVAPGNRQGFAFFLNEDGAPSAGSIPINFTTLGGPNYNNFTIPLGPPGTVARGIALTPANGADFFCIPPANVPSSGGPIITPGIIIYDNETTSAYLDWSDAALVSAIPVSGVAGAGSDFGDLTSTIVLPPCLGVIGYEDSLAWIGEWNNIKNFINMSFQGGQATLDDSTPSGPPLGWDDTTTHGGITPDQTEATATAPDDSGWMLSFAGATNNGLISQSAYQDFWGAPLILPNQQYTFICRAMATGTLTGGQLNIVLQSDSESTVYGTAVIEASNLNGTLSWVNVEFQVDSALATMPENIPSDMRLLIYRSGDYSNTISIADAFIVNANTPILANQIRFSYPANPFGYDNENGYTEIATTADPIVSLFLQRKYLYALTTKDLLQTFDNDEVPSEWGLSIFASNCGGSGPNAVDSQDDIAWWVGQFGAQIFDGSRPKKISQEIEPDFDAINWDRRNIISLASDPIQRVIYCAAPIDGSSVSNNIFTMNHRMTDPAVNITDPIHISSYTGKMIATDLARKWSPWPMACNSLAMAYILNTSNELVQAMTFGLGETGPTGADASSSATGSSGNMAVSLTPENDNDFVLVVGSSYTSSAPSGWTQVNAPGGGSFGGQLCSIQVDNDDELTFSAASPSPSDWSAVMASFAVSGTPTLESPSYSDYGYSPAGVVHTLTANAGDAIVVYFTSASSTAPDVTVGDSQSNFYSVFQKTQKYGSTYYTAYMAVALGCKAGSTTVTLNVSNYSGTFAQGIFRYSGLSGPENYGQIYSQDFVNYPPGNPAASEWNATDADYGTFASFYYTYFFFAHDVEQNAMLALYRKLFGYMSVHVVGTGDLAITPYVDSLATPWPTLPTLTMQVADPGFDYEWGLNVTGNRMSLELSCEAGGFWLTHLIVSARRDLVFPVRGAF